MGNIIGGVNPFEGTDVKLEDRPNLDEQEVKNTSGLTDLDSYFH